MSDESSFDDQLEDVRRHRSGAGAAPMPPFDAVTVTLWWEDRPDAPGALGRLCRVRADDGSGAVSATRPCGLPALDARHLDGRQCSTARHALKVYGLGVFALLGPPADHPTARLCEVCRMPPAAARELFAALAERKWL